MKDKIHENILLYRLQIKKDPQAFAELYDRYVNRIYRFVFFKVSTKETAEDITSEVFIKAWHYATEHREILDFSSLLYRIARNLVIDHYRDVQEQKEVEIQLPLLQEQELAFGKGSTVQITTESAEAEMMEKEELKDLVKYLRSLKDEYREVITMRYIDELSIKEIANVLGKSPIGVRVTLHRAIKSLKRITTHNRIGAPPVNRSLTS